MRNINLLILLICLIFLTSLTEVRGKSEITFTYLGQIKPRHARTIQSSNWSVGAETMDRDYTIYKNWCSYLGPLGFKKARLQAGWAKTERSKEVYDWQWLDEIIYDMVAGQGVEPWMCLCYGNPLYSNGETRLGAGIPKTEHSLQAWEKFVKAIVSRYKEQIDEWEVWNEPNLRKKNPPADYARFLILTSEAVRRVQPDAKILTMSLAGVDYAYTSDVLEILADKNKLSLVNEVTYHPYKPNPDESYRAVAKLRAVVSRYSDKITIRQGENGCPSARRKTKALSGRDWTELSQAKWALRRLLGDLGRDIPSSYFAIMDMKYPDEMNMKGLLKSRPDQTVEYAKPAYYALQNLAAVFDNSLQRIPEYESSTDTGISLSVFGYENKSSREQVVTIWRDDKIPSDNNDRTKVDFTFNKGRFTKPVYVDLRLGKVWKIPQTNWSRKDNVYHFKDIPCYDSPILIADEDNIVLRKGDGQ